MIDQHQLRQYVLRPALKRMGYHSPEAEELLLLTAAQESNMGQYIHQLGRGPACGIFQMEPRTYSDVIKWLKERRQQIYITLKDFQLPGIFDQPAQQMCGNLYYAAGMARAYYLRIPDPLPDAGDVPGMANYYKRYWNTHLGAATVDQAISNYKKYVTLA